MEEGAGPRQLLHPIPDCPGGLARDRLFGSVLPSGHAGGGPWLVNSVPPSLSLLTRPVCVLTLGLSDAISSPPPD